MIAMALLLEPKLVIMDEPTSALDVVAQRSLMHQVETLRHQLGFAVIFVTHDMSVVSHYSDRLAVMYAGEIVELGPTREVFDRPEHPYSQDSWRRSRRCSASPSSSPASPAIRRRSWTPRRMSLRAALRVRER